jgi:GT2 family glycosyltransferase
MPTHATPCHAILIAGMHRSGTSALARVVNLLGADLGDGLLPAREDNPRGYWEATDVIALNDECLQHFGTAWFDPSPLPAGWEHTPWTNDWRGRLASLLRKRCGDAPLVAIKDPRISRLLPVWLDAFGELGIEPHVAIALRHPDEVTASLGKRRDTRVTTITARLLWLTYLLEVERDSRHVSRAFVLHDAILADWRKALRELADGFGIAWPRGIDAAAADIDAFLDPDLLRQRAGRLVDEREGRLAARCVQLFDDLTTSLPKAPAEQFDDARSRLADDLELIGTPNLHETAAPSHTSAAAETLWTPSETVTLEARAYFPHADGHYDQARSREAELLPARGARHARFDCPADARLTRVRFDPAEAAGIYRILTLTINDTEIPATRCPIAAVGGIHLTDDTDGALRIYADNDDPWVEFILDGLLPGQTGLHTFEIAFERESISDRFHNVLHALTIQQTGLTDRLGQLQQRADSALDSLTEEQQRTATALQGLLAREADRDAMIQHLRETSHAALLAAHAASPAQATSPRNGIRLRPRPSQLQPLARRIDTDLRAWATSGPEARFALDWHGHQPLQPGWYVLRLALQSARAELAPPRLLVDTGQGFDPAEAIPLALTPGSLRQRPLLHLSRPVHALVLEPTPADPHGEFLFGDTLSLRRVNHAEALLRLGLPAVRRLRAQGARWSEVWRETRAALRRGSGAALEMLHTNAQEAAPAIDGNDYAAWIVAHDTLDDAARAAIRERIAAMPSTPSISVLLPVYNTPERWLRRCLDSMLAQLYPHWQLCIADDASTESHVRRVMDEYAAREPRIKVVQRAENGHISAASNSALKLASGDWIALLDHDDELPEHALYHVARAILDHPDAALIYSDEDKITEDGTRFDPYFKPDWNPELFLSQNMISHLGVYSTHLVRELGGFRKGFEGSQDYDLALRVIEHIKPEQIVHVPRILYHWRAIRGSTALATQEKNYAAQAAIDAVRDHLHRIGKEANVEPGELGYHNVRYALAAPEPPVSLIVPTRDRVDLLRTSVGSVLECTDYPDLELIIIDNQSSDPETLAWMDEVSANDSRVRILRFDEPFNFSRMNNFAVSHASGSIVGLLNNDIEAHDGNWLREMVRHATRDEIGAVGAKLYYPDGRIQHAGVIVGYLGVAGHAYCGKPHDHSGQMGRAFLTQNLSAVTAACLLIRKSVYLEVGGMNEELGVAFNDVDFCLRIQRAGYRNVWTPHAELVHHESASRGHENTPEKQARFEGEVRKMQAIWGESLLSDPAYNPNLSLVGEPYALADAPRIKY